MGWSGGKSSVQLHTPHYAQSITPLKSANSLTIPSVRTGQLHVVVNAHAITLVLYATLSCYAMSGGGGQPGTPGQCLIQYAHWQ